MNCARNSFMLLSRIMQIRNKGCCFSIDFGLPVCFDKFLAQNTTSFLEHLTGRTSQIQKKSDSYAVYIPQNLSTHIDGLCLTVMSSPSQKTHHTTGKTL